MGYLLLFPNGVTDRAECFGEALHKAITDMFRSVEMQSKAWYEERIRTNKAIVVNHEKTIERFRADTFECEQKLSELSKPKHGDIVTYRGLKRIIIKVNGQFQAYCVDGTNMTYIKGVVLAYDLGEYKVIGNAFEITDA